MLEDQTFIAALHNTLASTIQAFTNSPPVALQFLQQNVQYENHRSTDALTQIITNVRKIAMLHTSNAAKERKGASKAKFQAQRTIIHQGKELMDITSENREQIKLEETFPS